MSTAPKLLEYCAQITRVLRPNYSSICAIVLYCPTEMGCPLDLSGEPEVTLISEEMPSDYNDSSRVNNKLSLIETNPIKMNTEFLQQLKILTYEYY